MSLKEELCNEYTQSFSYTGSALRAAGLSVWSIGAPQNVGSAERFVLGSGQSPKCREANRLVQFQDRASY